MDTWVLLLVLVSFTPDELKVEANQVHLIEATETMPAAQRCFMIESAAKRAHFQAGIPILTGCVPKAFYDAKKQEI